MRRHQRGTQAFVVAPVRSGHDGHGSPGVDIAVDSAGNWTHDHVVDLVGVQPAEHGHRLLLEVLESLTQVDGTGLDLGRAVFVQHDAAFAPSPPTPAKRARRDLNAPSTAAVGIYTLVRRWTPRNFRGAVPCGRTSGA